MQDMPTGWYVRRQEEKQFRPQKAQPFGQMAFQWLTWESSKSGCTIRHQVNGREKRIGKRRLDGWCAETCAVPRVFLARLPEMLRPK